MDRNSSPATLVLAFALMLCTSCGAPTTDELFSQANEALAQGEISTANIHLRNLLRQNPDHSAARALLADVAFAMGDWGLAEESARRALALGQDSAALQLTLLRALSAQGKSEAVIEQYESGPDLSGQAQSLALRLLGAAQSSIGEIEQAELSMRAALALDPDSPDTQAALAAFLLQYGDTDEARQRVSRALRIDPEHVSALLLRARIERSANRIDLAEATLREVIRLEDSNKRGGSYAGAVTQLAEILVARGDLDGANAAADSLLTLNPRNPLARFIKASIEVQQGETDAAEQRLDALILDAPEFWPAYRLLGSIDADQGQLGQAVMNLQRAVTNNPADALARLQLAEVYARQGSVEEARQLFGDSPAAQQDDGLFLALAGGASRQVGQSDLASAYFDRAELFKAKSVAELASLTRVLVAAGEYDRALRIIEETSFEDSDEKALVDYLIATVHLSQGNLAEAKAIADSLILEKPDVAWPFEMRGAVAIAEQEFDEAREYLRSGLAVQPKSVSTLFALARLEIAQNNLNVAGDWLREVIEVDSGRTDAMLGLAEIAAAQNDVDEARSWLERVPDSTQRTSLLGRLALASGDFPEAADAFAAVYEATPSIQSASQYYLAARRAQRPDPEQKLLEWVARNPLDSQANFLLGEAALAERNLESAVDRYEAVLEVNPNNAATLNNLAWIFDQQGDERALDYAERAYEAAPDTPAIADTLGWLRLQHGDVTGALPLLENAAAELSEDADVQYHYAVALSEAGESARALEVLGPLLAGSAAFEGRSDAERLLARLRTDADSNRQ